MGKRGNRTKIFYLKNLCYFISYLLLFISVHISDSIAQPDAINPAPNVQSISAGSFVIPMDTIHQSIVAAGLAPFNLKAYGLINELFNGQAHIK